MIFFIVFVIITAIPLFRVFIDGADGFAFLIILVVILVVLIVIVVFPSIGLELQFNDCMTNITIGCESDFLENIIAENSRRKSFFVY
jgi:hypothetical protein